MLTAEQTELRNLKIGSSDAPIVAGVSGRKSPPELYYQMVGDLPRYDEVETLEQKFGHRLEAIIAEIAADICGLNIRRTEGKVHPVHTFMCSHEDFEIVDPVHGLGILEVKDRAGEDPWDVLPDEVMVQVVHQMAVANKDYALVAGHFKYHQIRTYEVERDQQAEDNLIAIERDFMHRVAERVPPPPVWGEPTTRLLKALYPRDRGTMIELPEIAKLYCQDLMHTKLQLKQQELFKSNLTSKLQMFIGENSGGTVGDYVVSWKRTKDGKEFDVEQFEKDHPNLFAQYQKTKPGHRRFVINQRASAKMKGARTL